MTSRTMFYFAMAGMLVAIASCVSLQPNRANPPEPAPTQSAARPAQPAPSSTNAAQPDTKIITMNLEGNPTEVELKRFHQAPLPFTTYYPEDAFIPEMANSESGAGVRFYFSPTGQKDKTAYLSFFFPNTPNSVESIQDLILGDRGLLIRNDWELLDRTDIVSYPWAKEKLLYQYQDSDNKELVVGAIYVGQEEGQSFYTLTHYPAEYGDGFEPRSNILLENLQFDE